MKVFYSKQVKEELDYLENSQSSTDNQRARLIRKGIKSAIANPLNTDNIPNGISGYFVQKASGQIRLFYTTEVSSLIGRYLFLSWVNPAEFPHDTNNGQANDPCYNEFKRLLNNNQIETFRLTDFSESFRKSKAWGCDYIQFLLERKINGEVKNRSTSIGIRQERTNHYSLTSLSKDDVEFATELLKRIIQDSEALSFTFSFELFLNLPRNDVENYQSILTDVGFLRTDVDDEIELWELNR